MSDEPRVLQAADVYNATHDLPLYEWVASLESQNEALQERIDAALREIKNVRGWTMHMDAAGQIYRACNFIEAALSPSQETDRPIRCQSRCDQWPNCQHDWRSWHNRPTQETSEPDRILSAAGAVTEPERVLIAAGVEALRPFVRSLRKMGWAAGITAHSDPLKVTLDIDLTGLKRPTQETDPG